MDGQKNSTAGMRGQAAVGLNCNLAGLPTLRRYSAGQAAIESNCDSTARPTCLARQVDHLPVRRQIGPLRGQAAIECCRGSTAGSLRGQAATEMLVMVAFALIFVLPIALLFLSSTGNELSKTSVEQAKITTRTIADEAGDVYLQGEHARKSIVVNYPAGVMNASIDGGLVVMSLEQDGRRMDVVSSSFANISGNLSGKKTAGLEKINLEYIANGSYVNISYG